MHLDLLSIAIIDIGMKASMGVRSVFIYSSHALITGGDTLSTSKYIAEGITVVYALFGIPLTVAFVTVMGRLLSRIPRQILKPLQHHYWIHLVVLFAWLFIVFVGIITIPAVIIATIEGWQYREALYFCFTTATTIGLGDYTLGPERSRLMNYPLRDFYKLCFVTWIFLAISHISTIITQVREVWGGLWMRMKKLCRQVKKIIVRAMRSGKRCHLGKAADIESAVSSKTDTEAKAKQVEKQEGKNKVQKDCSTLSEIVSRKGKVSRKGDLVTFKEPQPTEERRQ